MTTKNKNDIMKIYISGKVSGLDYKDVKKTFWDAEDLLNGLGFEAVNPLNNGLPTDAPWNEHMAKDISILLECDAIYMMHNWTESLGAGIEYDIAMRMKKDVWFESNIIRNQSYVMKIQNAIHEVTGMTFGQYTTKSRQRDGFYARMLFVYHCRKNKMKLVEIAKYVNRDHTSMLHLLNKYDDEVRYNSIFGDMAQKVNDILNRTNK